MGGYKRMKKLISYNQTPQVTALEYHEMRDLEKHPEKLDYYTELAERRKRNDRKEI